MSTSYRSASEAAARRPLFTALMTFPAACFIVTLITDIAYARSANMAWETFSIWLLTIGLIAAGVFVLVGLVQAFGQGRWPGMILRIGYAIALILSLINAFVHSRDAYTSVVPTGLTLSAVVVVILLVTWGLDFRAARRAVPA
jgi:uncharacterized membrane protein